MHSARTLRARCARALHVCCTCAARVLYVRCTCAARALQVIALSQSVTKGATRRLQKPFAYVSSRYGTGLSLATHHSPLNLHPNPNP